MKNEPEMVMYDSPSAARVVDGISGWVDRNGMFFGESESSARYSGCTHRACGICGQPAKKEFLYCKPCREKRDIDRYNAMPKKYWDCGVMVYSDSFDVYFNDLEEVNEFVDDHELTSTDDLRLILCEPNYLDQINEYYWHDDLPEEGELPESVIIALEDLNLSIKDAGPISWSPGKYAASLCEVKP